MVVLSSFSTSSLALIGWRAMKKIVQSAKKLSLKSAKKTKKKSVTPPVPAAPPGDDFDYDDLNDPWTPERFPKEGWTTDWKWSKEAVRSLDAFMDHYSSIGIEGIKDEFRKKLDGFKSVTYGDVAFKTNPTKNRDKDIMACLDGSRVELDDKQYINASWVFDKNRLDKKYILTQEPMRSTTSDFWHMIYQYKVSCIIVFSEKEEGWPPHPVPNDTAECGESIMNKFWPIKRTNGIIMDNLVTRRLNPGRHSQFYSWSYSGPMRPWLDTRLRTCKVKKHTHTDDEKKFGCEKTSVESFLIFIRKSEWNSAELKSTLRDVAMIARNGRNEDGPLVLMDDFSGTSRAAVLTVVDVMGSLLYKGEKNLSLPQVVKWVRCCRNGAIRTEDDYVSIVQAIFFCTKNVYMKNEEEEQRDEEEKKRRGEKYSKQYNKLFGDDEEKK